MIFDIAYILNVIGNIFIFVWFDYLHSNLFNPILFKFKFIKWMFNWYFSCKQKNKISIRLRGLNYTIDRKDHWSM